MNKQEKNSGIRIKINKEMRNRWLVYFTGLLILALGIILNTKAGLGVSPIISVAYCVSVLLDRNFGNITLIWYCSFVVVEIGIHCWQKREKSVLVMDVLQIPLSLVFTRFMNLFSNWIPDFAVDFAGQFWGGVAGRILILCLAIFCTGVGAALSLNVHIVPNPGDGIVQAISSVIGKSVGFTKNCFDLGCISLTIVVSLVFTRQLVGVGIGTVLAVIGVGRVIAVWNHFTKEKIAKWIGLA
ncbi:MAG: DUF6198 family protein [Lachnospiraceae bacterium]